MCNNNRLYTNKEAALLREFMLYLEAWGLKTLEIEKKIKTERQKGISKAVRYMLHTIESYKARLKEEVFSDDETNT